MAPEISGFRQDPTRTLERGEDLDDLSFEEAAEDDFEDKKDICTTKELVFHRYFYYVADKPRVSDYCYDLMEKAAVERKIPLFMQETGMVGYNEKNPFHQEILDFLKKYPDADQYLVQGYCWKELWPEQWEHLTREDR